MDRTSDLSIEGSMTDSDRAASPNEELLLQPVGSFRFSGGNRERYLPPPPPPPRGSYWLQQQQQRHATGTHRSVKFKELRSSAGGSEDGEPDQLEPPASRTAKPTAAIASYGMKCRRLYRTSLGGGTVWETRQPLQQSLPGAEGQQQQQHQGQQQQGQFQCDQSTGHSSDHARGHVRDNSRDFSVTNDDVTLTKSLPRQLLHNDCGDTEIESTDGLPRLRCSLLPKQQETLNNGRLNSLLKTDDNHRINSQLPQQANDQSCITTSLSPGSFYSNQNVFSSAVCSSNKEDNALKEVVV